MQKYNIEKERIIIISFSEHALRNLNKLTPGFKTNFLMELDDLKNDPSQATMTAEELITKLQNMGVTGVDARVGIALDRDYIQKVKSAGLDFHVWTIDNPDNAVRLKNAGVTSITTNRPIEIRKALFNK
jgi:glycerophosphoryl diester phosphodiesterase